MIVAGRRGSRRYRQSVPPAAGRGCRPGKVWLLGCRGDVFGWRWPGVAMGTVDWGRAEADCGWQTTACDLYRVRLRCLNVVVFMYSEYIYLQVYSRI